MGEKKQRRFFFSKGIKALLIILFLAAIGVFTATVTMLAELFQSGMQLEQITQNRQLSYEETYQCGTAVAQFLHRLPELATEGKAFFTNGKLNTENKVDITDLSKTGKEMNKYTTYTVGDIRKMSEDGTLQRLDEILFEVRNNMENSYYADEATEVEVYDADEAALEEQGTVTEESSWQYSPAFLQLYAQGKEEEKYLPQSGITLADYANKNPETVSLMDLYQILIDTGNLLSMYSGIQEELETESNVMYVVESKDDGSLYTNVPEWENGYRKIDNIDQVLYFHADRVNGRLENVDADSDAEKYLKEYFGNNAITGENETIDIMLNADYPFNDGIYSARQYYEQYSGWGKMLLVGSVISFLLGILTLVLLTIQAGRIRTDRGLHRAFGDGAPTEVALAVTFISLALLLTLGILFIDEMYAWDLFAEVLIVSGEVALGGIFLAAYMSVVRRIKGKRIWKSSLCYSIVQSCKKVYMARQTSGRMIIAFSVLMLGNIFAVSIFRGFGVVLALIGDSLVLLYLIREGAGRQVIRDGLARIASGELDFKIDASELIGDNKEMAEAVNHVGDGLQNAVKETLKSERLKADLITNVSHDIKTPLTSIINYVDLLKREDIQDPKIKGYIDILDSKSQRLKQLTEDLVEASKISSGNIVLDMQPIRLGELIRQTNGEFEEKFAARSLEIISRIPEEPVVILADGRRMWRVIENLYNNAAKYAMPGTRVYVEVKKIGCRVIFELKNVSEHPLNIRAEELTERFIRGDVSRSTEGSGLGLSIAQNLVKLQHGTFDIYLDGDLFKVTITFEATE